MSNLDAIRAMQAKQAESAEAMAPEATRGAHRPSRKRHGKVDAEIQAMNAEADLLSVIQADTGETGVKSGNRIDFGTCPVCGKHDCFRYYPDTNSWACFSTSNKSEFEGGMFTEYMRAAHGCDKVEAVKRLREATGHPYKPKPGADGQGGSAQGDAPLLPPWHGTQSSDPPKRNDVLIEGILRRGHVALIAAKGKAGKSWSAIQLSIAVATGGEWFGCKCASGNVLYLDPEIDPKSLDNRFAEVCKAVGADTREVDAHVSKWPLRGVEGATMQAIVHDLGLRCQPGSFVLVVIDSCSVFVEGDENSSVDVRKFFAKVLKVAAITGASVLLVHHYGKGSAGDRDTADRARGSSVFLDSPDATLYLTEVFPPSGEVSDYLQDGERAFILETGGLREFPAMKPKRLIYSFPVHRLDVDGVTEGWKPRSGKRDGGKKTAELKAAQKDAKKAATVAALLAHYYAEGIGEDGLLLKEAAQAVGLESRQLVAALDGCEHFEIVQVTQRKRYVRPKLAPRASPSQLPLGSD